jgi:hypothetical protein
MAAGVTDSRRSGERRPSCDPAHSTMNRPNWPGARRGSAARRNAAWCLHCRAASPSASRLRWKVTENRRLTASSTSHKVAMTLRTPLARKGRAMLSEPSRRDVSPWAVRQPASTTTCVRDRMLPAMSWAKRLPDAPLSASGASSKRAGAPSGSPGSACLAKWMTSLWRIPSRTAFLVAAPDQHPAS